MPKTFTADLRRFRDLTARNLRYIAVNAIQDVMEAAQTPQLPAARRGGPPVPGRIPVDTGTLIRSLVSGIGAGGGARGQTSYLAVIAGMELGDVLRFEWTANYAYLVEVGTRGRPGAHFVGFNAARFSEFVERRVAEVRR